MNTLLHIGNCLRCIWYVNILTFSLCKLKWPLPLLLCYSMGCIHHLWVASCIFFWVPVRIWLLVRQPSWVSWQTLLLSRMIIIQTLQSCCVSLWGVSYFCWDFWGLVSQPYQTQNNLSAMKHEIKCEYFGKCGTPKSIQTDQETTTLNYFTFKIQILWKMALFCWLSSSHCFERSLCLHLPDSAILGLLGPEDEGTVMLQNIQNHLPNKTMSHAIRPES